MPPSRVFRATLPVKPSVTTTSTASVMRSRPSTLPTKVGARVADPARLGQELVGLLDQRVALGVLLADRQQRHPRVVDAEAVAGVDRAHLGELDEPLGAALGVGAGVEQDGRRAAEHRDRRGDGGTGHALDAAHAQQGAGHRGSGVAGADHGRGRPSRTASAARTSEESFMRRTLAPASSSMAMTSEAAMTSRSPGSPISSGRPTSTTGDTERRGRLLGPGDDLGRRLVAAHGVDGDGKHGERQSTSMAWRPWYQPQLPHTTWGSLVAPQRGQLLRAGASSFQARGPAAAALGLGGLLLGDGHGGGASTGCRASERSWAGAAEARWRGRRAARRDRRS